MLQQSCYPTAARTESMVTEEQIPGSLTDCRVLQWMHHQHFLGSQGILLSSFMLWLMWADPPGSSWSSLNTSVLLGSSVMSLVQLQRTNNSHRINRRAAALRHVAISFLSVTAIMSQQQSHGANKKQVLRKPEKSESRQMDLRCSWFLTFCSQHSTSSVF